MQKRQLQIEIGDGHKYTVEIDENGKILRTACAGRWSLTVTATGSEWLDNELQAAVNRKISDEQDSN